jgi:molybdate transport system substrate-binding protein
MSNNPAGAARCSLLALVLFASFAPPAAGEEALVAVAANFSEVMERLEVDFERDTGHELTVSIGSTGKLYAQITNGAPFDVLLAADQKRPELLESEGLAAHGSRFTYAVGRLTLWSSEQEVASGNAELGFVALSYVLSPRNEQPGSRWDVPADLYTPIRQDAVLLARAADNPAAKALLSFLKSEQVRKLIESYGYGRG